MLKKPDVIQPVYNAGVVTFFEKVPKYDNRGTLLRNNFEINEVTKRWYRRLGKTNEDIYVANSDNKRISEKIAIRGDVEVNIKWLAGLRGKRYEIYRDYFNPKRNETELSLVEVSSE